MTDDDAKAIALAAPRMRAFVARLLGDLEALGLTPDEARARFNSDTARNAGLMSEYLDAARGQLAQRAGPVTLH